MKILQSTRIVRVCSGLQLARVSCGLTRGKLANYMGIEPRDLRRIEARGEDFQGWEARLQRIASQLTHLPSRAEMAMSQTEYAAHIGTDRPALSVLEALEHARVAEELGREVPPSTRGRLRKRRKGKVISLVLGPKMAEFVEKCGGVKWLTSLIEKEQNGKQ